MMMACMNQCPWKAVGWCKGAMVYDSTTRRMYQKTGDRSAWDFGNRLPRLRRHVTKYHYAIIRMSVSHHSVEFKGRGQSRDFKYCAGGEIDCRSHDRRKISLAERTA